VLLTLSMSHEADFVIVLVVVIRCCMNHVSAYL